MASSSVLKSPRIMFPSALEPLKDKNFALFWFGAFLSSIGFWIQTVGQGWQVLQLTNSALLLGLVVFSATLPNIVLSLFGGVIADRFNRRWLLIITQTAYMTTATLLGILTTLHIITVWQIIVMALVNGTFSSVGFPAWQTFIGELVQPEQLKQGIALNSMQFNLSRVVGPAIGGLSVGIFGIAGSYYLNALSYVAVLFPLFILHTIKKQRLSEQKSMWSGLGAGLRYVRQRPELQMILLLQFLIAFLVFPYATLLPIFAGDIFRIGATGLGILNAAAGIGALIGAVLVVLLTRRMKHSLRILALLCVVGGGTSVAFALSKNMLPSLLLLIVLGSCTVMSMTITNTTVQSMTPETMRARVLSIWVMLTFGIAPLGSLVAGWVAQSLGAPPTLAFGGLLCVVGALVVVLIQLQKVGHGEHREQVVEQKLVPGKVMGKAS
ncbi:MAG TPA: MFS transporter [Ktedonobacteraceae bacterium]|nr:MFS transporter [Ktedonobacteraceae bacterium]